MSLLDFRGAIQAVVHEARENVPEIDLPDLEDVDVDDYYQVLDDSKEAYVVNGVPYTAFLFAVLVVVPFIDQFTNVAFLIFLIHKFQWVDGHRPYPLEIERKLVFCAVLTVLAQVVDVLGTLWVFKEYYDKPIKERPLLIVEAPPASSTSPAPSSTTAAPAPPTLKPISRKNDTPFMKTVHLLQGYTAYLNYQFLDLYKCTGMRALRLLVTTLGAVPQLYATIYYTYYINPPSAGHSDTIPLVSMLLSFYSILELYSFELVWWVGRLFISIDWQKHQLKFWIVATITSIILFIYGYSVFWAGLPKHFAHPPPPPSSLSSKSPADGKINPLMGFYLFF